MVRAAQQAEPPSIRLISVLRTCVTNSSEVPEKSGTVLRSNGEFFPRSSFEGGIAGTNQPPARATMMPYIE
jgi:hypothetical protein